MSKPTKQNKRRIGILGGGVSAASLAYLLPKNKYTATILEKEKQIGGLASSFNKNGFVFDVGPHIIFAREKHILRWMLNMLGDNKQKLFRRNVSFYKGRFVKYPFENGLSQLPKEDTFDCLYHFLHNDYKKKPPENFREWMYYVFGKGIAEHYLLPYNKKIWKIDPAKMTLDWVGGRVPEPPAEDIIKSALGIETEGYTHQLHFYYPKTGGVQTLVNNILDKAKRRKDLGLTVETSFEVAHITQEDGVWHVESCDGRTREFDVLVNTMPLHILGRTGDFIPQQTKKDINKLRYNSLVLVYVGMKAPAPKDRFAVYFPEPDTLFHRVSYNDYISPNLSPRGHSSITAEITFRGTDAISKMSDAKLIQHVIDKLHEKKLIDKRTVVFKDAVRIPFEYPLYDFNYPVYTKRVYEAFAKIPDFYSCGRFAEFRYINMNDCIKSAMELVKKL